MANHVTTHCTVTAPAADVAAFRARMLITSFDENGMPFTVFDFNQNIPRPESLLRAERELLNMCGIDDNTVQRMRVELGMPRESPWELAAAYLAKHPEYEAAGRLRLRANLETGFSLWGPWCEANWGTKSNSYDFLLLSDNRWMTLVLLWLDEVVAVFFVVIRKSLRGIERRLIASYVFVWRERNEGRRT